MELKVNEYQLPEALSFNFEELKGELEEKVKHYETLVYSDEQIKEAKADKANLNKLKKALNDERIKREKEYMIPFNDFKSKINEIIAIIDKPVLMIDKQVKAFEENQKAEKLATILAFFNGENEFEWLDFELINNSKWLNASVTMKAIQEEIKIKLEQIKTDIATLSQMPEFGFEAVEVYKTSLNMNKALNEAQRMSQIAKAKAEQERLRAEAEQKKADEEFAKNMNPPVEESTATVEESTATVEESTAKEWISFTALLSVEDAQALASFFNTRGIEFKRA